MTKVVVITGASAGVGRATAEAFARLRCGSPAIAQWRAAGGCRRSNTNAVWRARVRLLDIDIGRGAILDLGVWKDASKKLNERYTSRNRDGRARHVACRIRGEHHVDRCEFDRLPRTPHRHLLPER